MMRRTRCLRVLSVLFWGLGVAAAMAALPRNRMPNTDFQMASVHPLMPDFWGIHRDGRLGFLDLGLDHYSIDDSMPTPIAGARALRLHNGPPFENAVEPLALALRQRFGWLIHERPRMQAPAHEKDMPRTFSVYLRAAAHGTRVTLHGNGWRTLAQFDVGTEWQRFHHVYDGADQPSLSLNGEDVTVWIAAPQLEIGDALSSYVPGPETMTQITDRGLESTPVLHPIRLSRPPRLDGRVAGDVWDDLPVVSPFRRLDGTEAQVATEAWVAYDDTALYFAFKCHEPAMDQLRAEVTQRDGSVFNDDSVQIFLSPSLSAEPYYQFAVNALGTQFDARGIGGDALRWDAEWVSKIYRGESFWSVEIAIPFASLPLASADAVWRVNLGRSRTADLQIDPDDAWGGQPREHTVWSGATPDEAFRPTAGFHDRGRFGRIMGLDPTVIDPYRWSLEANRLDVRVDGRYEFSGRLVPGAGQNVDVRLEFSPRNTRLRGLENPKLAVRAEPLDYRLTGLQPHPALGEYEIDVVVYDTERQVPLHRRRLRIEPGDVDLRPLRTALDVYPEYADITVEERLRVRSEWHVPEPVHVRVWLSDAAGNPVGEPVESALDGAAQFTAVFPVAGLPVGAYRVSAEAWNGTRREQASTEWRRQPPVSHDHVRMNAFTRGLEVDGLPFFPTFLPISPLRLDLDMLVRLRRAGFNTLTASLGDIPLDVHLTDGIPDSWLETARATLDRMQTAGLRMVVRLDRSWGLRPWYSQREWFGGDIEHLARAMSQVVEVLRDHPVIIAWYMEDEPSPGQWESRFGYRAEDMQVLYQRLKAADPYRPVYVNWNNAWPAEPYGGVAATDILSHDDYSISGRPLFDLDALVFPTRLINNEYVGRRPSLIWTSGSYAPSSEPPPHAVRVHGWLHLVYGTRGIGYWSTQPMNPDVWDVMQQLNHESVALSRDVFGPRDAVRLRTAVHNRRIHYAVWSQGRQVWLFGINTDSVPVTMALDLSGIPGSEVRSAARLFDDAPVSFESGVLRDEFPAFGRKVFVFERIEENE